jgi:predicted DNA-binding protein
MIIGISKKMAKIMKSFLLEKENIEILKQVAKADNRSQANVVNLAIRKYCEEFKKNGNNEW